MLFVWNHLLVAAVPYGAVRDLHVLSWSSGSQNAKGNEKREKFYLS